MGRGGVGGGGRSHSSSHRSSSHSSSGHRSSSSSSRSRGGTSSSSHSYSRSSSYHSSSRPPSYGYHSHPHYTGGGRYYGPSYRQTTGSSGARVATVIIVFIMLLAAMQVVSVFSEISQDLYGGNYTVTTHQGLGKTKMSPLAEFRTDCVIDEDGWFNDPYNVGRQLKTFYDTTGLQPYVLIKAPDSRLTTDSMKEQYADEWYYDNIDHEGALLYVYFAETNPDIEGYSVLIGGSSTKAFFDSAATQAFWDIYDSYYYNISITEEQLIVKTFTETAKICVSDKTITNTSKSGLAAIISNIVGWIIGITVAVVVFSIIVVIIKNKRAKDAAEAAETARILETPIEQLGSKHDSLVQKYTDSNNQQ